MAVTSAVGSDLAPMTPQGRKYLIPLNGRPAAMYLVENLKRCDLVSNVIVVSDQPNVTDFGADETIEVQGDLTDCVLAGIRAVSGSPRCLIMSGDMPLASPDAISDLLTCAPATDVVYPIVEKSDINEVFPGRKPYYVETKEGHYTGSSCLLFKPDLALSREQLLMKLLNARSNPKELLSLVGPWVAMKFMMSKLALGEFEQILSKALNMTCRVFISHFPELITSIDTLGDINLMEKELSL